MTKLEKNRWYSITILICMTLLISSFPFSIFVKNEILLFGLTILSKIIAIIFFIYYSKKENLISKNNNPLLKKHLLLLPLILLCFSNFFVVLISKDPLLEVININLIIKGLILSFLTAVIEELLFRLILLNEFLKYQNKFKSLFYSSLIFGLIHLLNISSLQTILPSFIQVGYTFILGLFIGFIFIFTKNISLAIIFHFLFNFINNTLVSNLYNLSNDLNFYIINIIIGFILLIYLIFITKILYKEDK